MRGRKKRVVKLESLRVLCDFLSLTLAFYCFPFLLLLIYINYCWFAFPIINVIYRSFLFLFFLLSYLNEATDDTVIFLSY